MLVLAVAAHLLFSGYGFNPTDEGFILGYSKRVLNGEIPHSDFISIRPALSAYLHTLDFTFGTERLFYNSRLIAWLMLSMSIGIWLFVLATKIQSRVTTIVIGVISFLVVTHDYPVMAWHTIDGIFLCSLGYLALKSEKPGWAIIGSILLGAAYLCKQNFLLAGPVFIFFHAPKKFKALIAWLLPGALYWLMIKVYGASAEMFDQFKTETSLLKTGIWQYISSPYLWLGVLAGIGHWALSKWQSKATQILWLLGVTAFLGYALHEGAADFGPVFLLTGMALTFFLVNQEIKFSTTVCGLFLAWSASISIGLNSPVLAATPIALLVFTPLLKRLHIFVQFAVVAVLAFGYWQGRAFHTYRDVPYERMTQNLSELNLGLDGIKTNERTFGLLKELDGLSNEKIIVLPYSGAFWASQKKSNPISSHWTSGIELANPALKKRVIDEVDLLKIDGYKVLIPKYRVDGMGMGKFEYESYDRFPVMHHVTSTWQMSEELSWWWVFE